MEVGNKWFLILPLIFFTFIGHEKPPKTTLFLAEKRPNFWQNIFGCQLPSKIADYRRKWGIFCGFYLISGGFWPPKKSLDFL
jgi:hypothetical protein